MRRSAAVETDDHRATQSAPPHHRRHRPHAHQPQSAWIRRRTGGCRARTAGQFRGSDPNVIPLALSHDASARRRLSTPPGSAPTSRHVSALSVPMLSTEVALPDRASLIACASGRAGSWDLLAGWLRFGYGRATVRAESEVGLETSGADRATPHVPDRFGEPIEQHVNGHSRQ
jgi:hypothetical protein